MPITQECTRFEKVSLTEGVNEIVSITWAAHHATRKRSQSSEVSITSVSLLLRNKALAVATIMHTMEKIQLTVAFLNPVIATDQPLYALAKQIQWQWQLCGEDKFIVMFGGLHVEMAGQ